MNPSRKARLFAIGFALGCVLSGGAILYRFSLGPAAEEGPPALTWRTVESTPGLPPLSDYPAAAELGEPARQGEALDSDGQLHITAWLFRPAPEQPWRRLEYHHLRGEFSLFYGDRLRVQANPAIDPRMIRDGFEHLGHAILEVDEATAVYLVSAPPLPWETLQHSADFLATRGPYLLSANRIAID